MRRISAKSEGPKRGLSGSSDFSGEYFDIAFKNLIYDLYSKDLSEKIISVRRMKASQGKFITSLAKQHLERNYIGIEKFSSALIYGLRKQEELALLNLFFLREDAEYCEDEQDT